MLKHLLEKVRIPDYIHAFERGRSIPSMARLHTGQDVVVSLDIKDFFPSIKHWHVQSMFTALGAELGVAKTLAEFCTYKAFVPQGAITSPKISNLIVAATFGPGLASFCETLGVRLTIYADDITMSLNASSPEDDLRPKIGLLISAVGRLLRPYGFQLNSEKTKVMFRHTRQWVCGAVVNDKVNLLKHRRRALRAIVHNCRKNGIGPESESAGQDPVSFMRQIAGELNWFYQLNPDKAGPLRLAFKRCADVYTAGLNVEIPEFSWSSSVEIPLDGEAENEERSLITEQHVQAGAEAEPAPF
jgi:retron-type reverse transcriptase